MIYLSITVSVQLEDNQFSSVQLSHSVVSDSLWLHGLQHARPPCPPSTPGAYSNSCPLSQWSHPTIHPMSSPSPPAFNLSQHHSLFQWSALCIRWPKYWNVSISPSNGYSGLISFRMDWLDLLAYQGTLKSLIQHHSLKASILWHSAFFIIQLSHPYMTTGKTIALTRGFWLVDNTHFFKYPTILKFLGFCDHRATQSWSQSLECISSDVCCCTFDLRACLLIRVGT